MAGGVDLDWLDAALNTFGCNRMQRISRRRLAFGQTAPRGSLRPARSGSRRIKWRSFPRSAQAVAA